MANYECCFAQGSQFVFIERPTWLLGCFVFVALFGLLVGLVFGLTISVGGLHNFELTLLSMACLAATRGYYTGFQRESSSVDLSGYIISLLLWGGIGCLLWAGGRYAFLNLGAAYCVALFSFAGVVLGSACYVYVRACCHEDERKHTLTMLSQNGDHLAAWPEVGQESASKDSLRETFEMFARFVNFSVRSQWYEWTEGRLRSNDNNDSPAAGSIIVHNKSLKLIKVCIYAHDDVFCWVPIGGVAGCCVGFIRAGQSRSFSPPWTTEIEGSFRLKVFQPCLFDKELTCYPKAERGQVFAFYDVEGMVKRSRSLSSSPFRKNSDPMMAESSESELEVSSMTSPSKSGVFGHSYQQDSGTPSTTMGLGRSQSSFQLRSLCEQKTGPEVVEDDASTASPASTPPSPAPTWASTDSDNPTPTDFASIRSRRSFRQGSSARRAAPTEVVLRNRSSNEIRALLFKTTDFSFVVPLAGPFPPYGDCILPDQERRFDPAGTDEEFTLKIYSVGPGARELTYFTVERGQAYNFGNSLLS